MPLKRRTKVALGVGSAIVVGASVGYLVWSAVSSKDPPKPGSLLCPGHVGRRAAPSASLSQGDFVVVQLQSGDGKFSESTWATIVEAAGDDVIAVVSGEQIPEGVRPLRTDKHGFRLGHKLVLPRDCIWEVFRPVEHYGSIVCGPKIVELAEFLERDDLFPVQGGLTVEPGDRARIVVAGDAKEWSEELWTKITTITPSGQVVTAVIDEEPRLTDHGLSLGNVVRYNRDCIVGVA